MIALLQRVTQAEVTVNQQSIARIQQGLLVLLAVEKADTSAQADKLLERLLNYRVFADDADKMNRSLRDINGGLLLVPQFTLAANTDKGNRPSFASAAPPAHGLALFNYLQQRASTVYPASQFGQFGADMQVSLINDGPVTFRLVCREPV